MDDFKAGALCLYRGRRADSWPVSLSDWYL
jgi:hypothetical protein